MTQIRRIVIQLLIVCITLLPYSTYAGMIGTEAVVADAIHGDRATVLGFLARADVQKQMQAFGISPELATTRVNALTDEEIQRLAGRIGSLPAAGADATYAILGIIVGIIIAVVYRYW